MRDTGQDSLAGKLLIAMPGISDPHFQRSVVYLCAHSKTGALGVVINRPAGELRVEEFLQGLDMAPNEVSDRPIYKGGPVEHDRGFVLHSPDYSAGDATMIINRGFAMTSTTDVLRDIAKNSGPKRWLIALGYAGWDAGQLDAEILDNTWLTLQPGPGLVFSDRDDDKWADALNLLGVSPQMLSGVSGRA